MSMRIAAPAAGSERKIGRPRLPRSHRAPPPLIVAAFVVMAVLAVLAMLAPVLVPDGLSEQSLHARLEPPGVLGGDLGYPLGADHLGRDVLARLLHALQTTLVIAGLGVAVGAVSGAIAGLVSGSIGGWVDAIFMLLVDAQASIPLTLLALAAVAVIGTSPIVLILIVGISDYDKYARVVRAQVMATRQRSFVEAARALGASPTRVAVRHILPNIASSLLVLATLNFSSIVILESALSFLGVGVQPPHTSLGQMLGDARNYMLGAWWLAAIPATAIIVITMSVSLVGDWLRDVLDPRLKV